MNNYSTLKACPCDSTGQQCYAIVEHCCAILVGDKDRQSVTEGEWNKSDVLEACYYAAD